MKAGVIAVQGDVSEHAAAIRRAGQAHGVDVETVSIRQSGIVPDCDLLAIPGGESTTISRLVHDEGIAPEIRAHVTADKPVLATCAGLIVLSRDAKDDRVSTLDLLDATVDRNAFGRQADSFRAPIDVTGLEDPFPGVFIRAPVVDEVGDGVETLSTWGNHAVAVREGPILATAFHPELTEDVRIHRLAFFDAHLAVDGDNPEDDREGVAAE
ncbi:putative glutamine amidotransferase involved inpyridoxine biosynthesis [Halalkaliarchaeum sp. AArc-CO]|uniref:pyridoxal 5'-phosphate synthase glutaminase subunit PdxT n=1 Tax=unclassified Halalkaliarchaeum TaxID=2678344 RepID=UPI00217E3531|nr:MULTISPECIES: pyridoxal 5'-phosphate synthase glutaminase subunit PdxT [unclassified Halalkaliarchaeum]MDR5674565.1 pyridoxal 5'-phosphate synthase glutaminase subunit PdxT [Halalkaliarchaeum sp. AArc-GB]UWG49480.1 putative glutamine amidotransferase involved inpyridoxine biosynthesis [Halalkaliarchaeum sp. AArc-CO]